MNSRRRVNYAVRCFVYAPMAEIQYTHRWDGCFKGVLVIGGLIVAWFPIALLDNLLTQMFGDSFIKIVVSLVLLLLTAFGLMLLIIRFFGHLPDYLYLRVSLGIPISYAESKTYAFLLTPDEEGRWVSLSKITSVPTEQRKDFLLATASAVLNERKNKLR